MKLGFVLLALACSIVSPYPAAAEGSRTPAHLSTASVNQATFSPPPYSKTSPVVLKAQVLLDRARFSPGVIDGREGDNFKKALTAFQSQNGLSGNGELDQATFDRLSATSSAPVLTEYEITSADLDADYVKSIPKSLEQMARMARLSYTGPREAIAKRFHMSEELLKELNPDASFDHPGEGLVIANVHREKTDRKATRRKVTEVVVDKEEHAVRAYDSDGMLEAFYPASIGSEEKPAPSGTFRVKRIARNPTYHYNPKFGFKGVEAQHKLTIQPGPNNPVGLVWIDLTAPSYGIHGTPDPENIGKTESHGCIRLTNWDALALAALVRKGTKVEFVDETNASGGREQTP